MHTYTAASCCVEDVLWAVVISPQVFCMSAWVELFVCRLPQHYYNAIRSFKKCEEDCGVLEYTRRC